MINFRLFLSDYLLYFFLLALFQDYALFIYTFFACTLTKCAFSFFITFSFGLSHRASQLEYDKYDFVGWIEKTNQITEKNIEQQSFPFCLSRFCCSISGGDHHNKIVSSLFFFFLRWPSPRRRGPVFFMLYNFDFIWYYLLLIWAFFVLFGEKKAFLWFECVQGVQIEKVCTMLYVYFPAVSR